MPCGLFLYQHATIRCLFIFHMMAQTRKKIVRPKIRAFVPRRENRATQWTSPADATRKRVYCRLRKRVTDLLGGRAPRTANWASFYRQKTTLLACYIRVTKWLVTRLQSNPIGTNFTGYMFTKQFYWYNFAGFCSNLSNSIGTNGMGCCSNLGAHGLFSSPAGFYWVHIDWLAPGHPMGWPFHGKAKPKSRPPASPSPGSPT